MEALNTYLHMGGHGGFIWASYGAVLVVLLGLWAISRRFVQSSQSELQGLNVDRPHHKAKAADET